MYQVLCDGKIVYDPRLEDRVIFNASLELELNKTGSFNFTIYPTHPVYGSLVQMSSKIEVLHGGERVFRGRILDIEQGFYNEKQVYCEGELAFLCDSIISPYGTQEQPVDSTIKNQLERLINSHNAAMSKYPQKQFAIGTVSNEFADLGELPFYQTDFKTTLDAVLEMAANYGGYIWITYTDADKAVINLLSDLDIPSNQPITFGKNLLDVKKTTKGSELMTAILPVGGKSDGAGENTTINVNGLPYIVNETAAANVGLIVKVVKFDDITDAAELEAAAREHLEKASKFSTSVELTAADLSGIEKDVDPFRLGQKISVIDDKHGIEGEELDFLVNKLSLDILKPANNKLTIGTTFSTFTQSTSSSSATKAQIAQQVQKAISTNSGYASKAELVDVKNDLEDLQERVDDLVVTDGKDGKDGIGISSIDVTTTTEDSGENLITITKTDGTSATFAVNNGSKGEKGDKGDKGETGAKGEKGDPGAKGDQGIQGEVGEKGDKGDTGAKGDQGIQGEVGEKGADGVSATHKWSGTTLTVTSASGTSSANLKGEKGDKGDQGIQGEKGDTGDSGVITATQGQPTFAVEDGYLYVYLPTGSENPYELGEDGCLYMTVAKVTEE